MPSAADIITTVPLPYGSAPLDWVLTAGQPTAAQIGQLGAAGLRTIIDLRPANEPRGFDEPAAARAAGVVYHNVPVTPATLSDAGFDRVREILADPEHRPVLVHCASANRVGALLIPYLELDAQLSAAEALATARRIGLRSDELARIATAYTQAHRQGEAAR
jgi:uncharacterized protein (TIGR01244 family)